MGFCTTSHGYVTGWLISVVYWDSLSIRDCHLTLELHDYCDPNKPDVKALLLLELISIYVLFVAD